MENIKIGGCYQKKDKTGWLLVLNKYDNNTWQTRDIEMDDTFYDEEIADLDREQIEEIADLSICYRPYYHKEKGLYAIWDEAKPHDQRIILQK